MAKSSNGPLRRLRIEQNDPVEKNTANEGVANWVPIVPTSDGCVWAEVEELTGREYLNSDQVQAEVDTRIKARRFVGVNFTPDMRGVEVGGAASGTIYNFRSVRNADDDRSMLEIMAVKVVTNPRK